MSGLVVLRDQEARMPRYRISGPGDWPVASRVRFSPSFGIMMADWENLGRSLSDTKPVVFTVSGVGRYQVPLNVHIIGSQREEVSHGHIRMIRGVHAARFVGEPTGRPTLTDAQVVICGFDLRSGEGEVVRTPWLEKFLQKLHHEIEEYNRGMPDF